MADALLSPTVGMVFIAGSAVALGVSAKKLGEDTDERKVPLMGVLGAFVFAAQMINFTIPATGSSGHLGGGMLLAMLLGPYAAFITIASVLVVQALIFADGGILALGTNIWNLGVYPCFVGWLIYKAIAGKEPSGVKLSIAAVVGVLVALEMGALSVVVETVLSGRSELPFGKFSAVMLGIHLPIAIVEGLVTVAVVNFVYRIRPEVVKETLGLGDEYREGGISYKPVLVSIAAATLLVGGVVAWFASSNPDGLEWTIAKVYGHEELAAPEEGIIPKLAGVQEKVAPLPDYGFKPPETETAAEADDGEGEESWPAVSGGTTVSGILGSGIVLALVGLLGIFMIKIRGVGAEKG